MDEKQERRARRWKEKWFTPELREAGAKAARAADDFYRLVLLGNVGGITALVALAGVEGGPKLVDLQDAGTAFLVGVLAMGFHRYGKANLAIRGIFAEIPPLERALRRPMRGWRRGFSILSWFNDTAWLVGVGAFALGAYWSYGLVFPG